jgi:hypothetical protein
MRIASEYSLRWTLPPETPNYAKRHSATWTDSRPSEAVLDSADLAGGFEFGGERIPLINPQRGIFKPRQMAHLLSIKTVFPRKGARVWYDDQRDAHRQIYAGDDVVDYQFMGTDLFKRKSNGPRRSKEDRYRSRHRLVARAHSAGRRRWLLRVSSRRPGLGAGDRLQALEDAPR